MDDNIKKVETCQIKTVPRRQSSSFEQYFMSLKNETNRIKNKANKKKKLRFIDDIHPDKGLEDIVNVESFKQYNVNTTEEEIHTSQCTCVII